MAALDFGSNTVGYMIVERGSAEILERDSRFVRLAEGLVQFGELQPQAIERTLSWVEEILARLQHFGVDQVRAVGTEAIRRAGNAEDLIEALQERGIQLEVISGQEEGELTFGGVRCLYPTGPLVVLDVGGGSTEIAWSEGSQTSTASESCDVKSLPLGAVVLTDSCGEDYEALLQTIHSVSIKQLPKALPGEILTVLGGTGANMAMIDKGATELDDSEIEGHLLSPQCVKMLREKVTTLDPEQRMVQFGVPRRRADIMLAGFAMVESLIQQYGLASVRVSRRSLRHGLIQFLQRGPKIGP